MVFLCVGIASAIAQDSDLTPRQRRALVHLGHLQAGVRLFEDLNGDSPRALQDLVERPKDAARWPEGGFYPGGTIPKDPWGNDYEYDPRGEELRIWSWGADGKPGGAEVNRDLSNAELFSKPKREEFSFDRWEAWSSFGLGSWVELEIDTAGIKMRQRKILERVQAGLIVLRGTNRLRLGDTETESPFEEEVKKSQAVWTPKGDCRRCGKPLGGHPDESTWTTERVKVRDREIECRVWESARKNCQGTNIPRMKVWYSREVPGWIVRTESSGLSIAVTGFGR